MGPGKLHWLGHASFRIDAEGSVIYIDPWKLPSGAPKADIIFVTHSHYDHLSVEDIEKIRQEETLLIGPPDVTDALEGKTMTVEPGKTYPIRNMSVDTVRAYNLEKSYHPKKNNWVGYVITLPDGTRVYHAGDTDAIPEMKNLEADFALLPCGGTYTMDGQAAGRAASSMNVKTVVPMHWGDIVGSRMDAEKLKSVYSGNTMVYESER